MKVGAKIAGGVIAAAVSLVATYEGRSLVAYLRRRHALSWGVIRPFSSRNNGAALRIPRGHVAAISGVQPPALMRLFITATGMPFSSAISAQDRPSGAVLTIRRFLACVMLFAQMQLSGLYPASLFFRSIDRLSLYPEDNAHAWKAANESHSVQTLMPRPPQPANFGLFGLLHRLRMFFQMLCNRDPVAPCVLLISPIFVRDPSQPQDRLFPFRKSGPRTGFSVPHMHLHSHNAPPPFAFPS